MAGNNDKGEAGSVRILLAEDEKINQLAMRMLLKQAGFETETADNGRQVLDLLAEREFDCVLMDIQMPNMDGLEATRAIRSGSVSESATSIPVFALTAHAMESDRNECLNAGMTDFLTKPVVIEDVQRMLRKYGIAGADPDAQSSR